jgi:hypothetical protein
MQATANRIEWKKRVSETQMSMFPKYRGWRTMEYMPVVFSVLALGFVVVRPEVPRGACPTA